MWCICGKEGSLSKKWNPLNEHFNLRWDETLPVEVDGGFEWVSLRKQLCTCQHFSINKVCDHIQYATELHRGYGRGNRFVMLSSLHKEIRRGDVDKTLSWAWIILNNTSPESLRTYLTKIHFEETRAVKLWEQLTLEKLNLFDHIVFLTLVKKKWDLPLLRPHITRWHEGYQKFKSSDLITPLELRSQIFNLKNTVDIYELYFQLKEQKGLRKLASEYLLQLGESNQNSLLSFMAANSEKSYELMSALEIAIGLHDPLADAISSTPNVFKIYLPQPQNYHYDLHTWAGLRNLKKYWPTCVHQNNFQLGPVDLRFSGMVLGALFREKASEQFSDIKSVNWNQVHLTKGEVEQGLELDRYFYSKFFNNLKTTNEF